MTEMIGNGGKTMSRGQYGVNKKHFIIKLIVVLFFLFTLFEMIAMSIEDAAWDAKYYSKDNMIRQCDEEYYDRDFAGLLWYLKLYELYDDDYAIYWEIVNAYNDYVSWHAWKGALESREMQEAVEKEAQARQRLEENSKNCKFEKNQKILDSFIEK